MQGGEKMGAVSYLDICSSGAVASFGFTTAGGAGASRDAGALEATFDFATTSSALIFRGISALIFRGISALIFRGVCAALPVLSDGTLRLDCLYT